MPRIPPGFPFRGRSSFGSCRSRRTIRWPWRRLIARSTIPSLPPEEKRDRRSGRWLEPRRHRGSTLDFLRRTALDAQISSDKVLAITRKYQPAVTYPNSQLASSLGLVGRLIAGGLPTRVYYVAQGGYDTHANQANAHERLMGDLDAAMTAFVADLKAQGNFNRVTLMTFSEFGRRVEQNASGGTDHGAAAPMFVVGGNLKAGLYGQYPSLTQLSDGDLIYNVDFRSVYATVLEKGLRVPSVKILERQFPTMGFI